MIVVVADDLSGAAELAGIGARAGMSVSVQTEFEIRSRSDLVVLDTDSRSLAPADAAARAAAAALAARTAGADWIYKKIDSVLRGPIAAEISEICRRCGYERALIVPANPARGRRIQQGTYLVDGVPLDATVFARDPEFPAVTADVVVRLGAARLPVVSVRRSGETPVRGLAVADAADREDLEHWSAVIDPTTLAAGAAEFFECLLAHRTGRQVSAATGDIGRAASTALFVCGSPASLAQRLDEARRRGIPAAELPAALMADETQDPDLMRQWINTLAGPLARAGRLLIAAGLPLGPPAARTHRASAALAVAAGFIAERAAIDHLYAEGGATGSALARHQQWTHFTVHAAPAPGVVGLRADAGDVPVLFVKPGSYDWPPRFWEPVS